MLNILYRPNQKNHRGQISIFVILIFNVLFVFFAMVINVGLLVHHKINLQNSVDLAVYYGAQKQAEMLNAIAHTNYQIRQSYKLLAFRYQIMGSSGNMEAHPYWTPNNYSENEIAFATPNAYCVSYQPTWSDHEGNDNTCKKIGTDGGITKIGIPSVIADFLGFTQAIRDAAIQANRNIENACKNDGSINFTMISRQYAAYVYDQANRKMLINQLAGQISDNAEDFLDLEGNSTKEGMAKTLDKNLTTPNKKSLSEFKVVNGLALGGCGASVTDAKTTPPWLSEIKISPGMFYADFDCQNPTVVRAQTKSFLQPPQNISSLNIAMQNIVNFFAQRNNQQLTGIYTPSLGFEKNPWCMAYVGLSATATPAIPFSPFGPITIKAKAFAKPFGGKIGPWYRNLWPNGANESAGEKVSELNPPRLNGSGEMDNVEDPTRLPNYARYVGDNLGLRSVIAHKYLTKGMMDRDATGKPKMVTKYGEYNEIMDSESAEDPKDPVAWDKYLNVEGGARKFELSAISPDLYDTTYYSIEPDFANYYLPKLQSSLESKVPFKIRGDLGWRNGDAIYGKFSIKDQIQLVRNQKLFDVDTKLTYYLNDFPQLLTSWVTGNVDAFGFDTVKDRFGKCGLEVKPNINGTGAANDQTSDPTPGNCITGGGRTGYSVKLISEDYLKTQDLTLGGDGQSGPIRNLPPEGF